MISGWTEDEVDSVFKTPDYGNWFEIQLNLFKRINDNFRLDNFIEGDANADLYKPIRRFFNALNSNKIKIFNLNSFFIYWHK